MNDSTTKKKDSTCKKIGLIFIKRHRAFITTQCVVITLFIIGVLFLAAGILFIVMTNNLFEFEIRYDDICVNQTKNCLIYFNLTEELRGDIVFLYRLSNFYQNHRRIFQSKSYGQLKGEYLTYNDLSTCSPMISEGNSRDPSKLYLPCGLASFSFFNDTYRFVDDEIDFNFTDHNISLKTDREKLFKPLHSRYTTGLRWLENMTENGQTNEHFIVWMRTAAMPNFIKLYSKCHNCHISPGYYAISVDMNYPLEMYKGSRYIMISTTSALGSKSYFLSVTYLVIGGLSLLFSLSFLLQLLICPSKFGEVGEIFSHKVEQAQTIDQRLTSTNLPRLPTARRAFSQGNSREHSSSNNLPSEIPLSQRSLSLSVNTRLSHSPRSAQASLRSNDQYLKRSRQSGKNSGKGSEVKNNLNNDLINDRANKLLPNNIGPHNINDLDLQQIKPPDDNYDNDYQADTQNPSTVDPTHESAANIPTNEINDDSSIYDSNYDSNYYSTNYESTYASTAATTANSILVNGKSGRRYDSAGTDVPINNDPSD